MNILGVQMQDKTALIIGGVGLVLIYWAGKKVTDGVSGVIADVGQSLNPTSANNIAYRGVNGVGAVLSGDDNFSLGSWLYDVLNPSQSTSLKAGTIDLPTSQNNNWGIDLNSGW